ncbi:sodium:solute symporter family protein [Virgibacillus salexigens]|uniref:sodium:solute symporter family protein n=1 Tax=Virgibacillus salexigens TaxID=61016 RepID=UPI00190D1CDA|nr:sodium:solute symporter family protein [Virgibacillus salexigens]
MFTEQERFMLSIIVVVYFCLLFVFSLYINQRKIKTYEDYNVAGRSVSMFPIVLTFVGTAIGGSILLGFMENGYRLGMGQHWLNAGILITGIITASFLVKKIRQIGEKHHMVTLGDFTALRYGEGARIPTVISVLLAYCAITGMQFVAIATILNLTLGLSMTVGIIISWLLLTAKTYFGGLKSVVWQDAVHGTIQTIGIIVLFIVILWVSGDWEGIAANAIEMGESASLSVMNISVSEVLVYLFTIGGYQFVRQDLWQRFWAAKDYKTAMYGYWISIMLAFLIGVMVIVIGVLTKYGLQMTTIAPSLVYYESIGAVFQFPLVAIMIIALMATIISCADSFFMAASSSIINDIIKPRMNHASEQKMLKYSRYSVIFVSIIALFLALYMPQLVVLWVIGTAMLVSGLLAPAVIGLFWKGATQTAGISAMWIGLCLAVVWQLAGHPFGIHPVFIGLPLSTLTLIFVSWLTKADAASNIWTEAK